MKIATLNCNGLRAAMKKGLLDWVQEEAPDIICLQEVRFNQQEFKGKNAPPIGWHWVQVDAEKKGYSSVAIWSKQPPVATKTTLGLDWADKEGRAVCMEFANFDVWSIYFPSGTSGEERQNYKDQFLLFMTEKMAEWKQTGRKVLVCGDVNIAHTALDIFHDKSNANSSGFLPHERAWMTDIFSNGWVDVFRKHNQGVEAYSWWSNRRKTTRINNVGWRIDYQMATENLAHLSTTAHIVDRKLVLSDHTSVIAEYDISF